MGLRRYTYSYIILSDGWKDYILSIQISCACSSKNNETSIISSCFLDAWCAIYRRGRSTFCRETCYNWHHSPQSSSISDSFWWCTQTKNHGSYSTSTYLSRVIFTIFLGYFEFYFNWKRVLENTTMSLFKSSENYLNKPFRTSSRLIFERTILWTCRIPVPFCWYFWWRLD